MQIEIEKLSKDRVDEATDLIVNTFDIKDELDKQTLKASVEKDFKLYKKLGIKDMQYWIVVKYHKVIAITGLYTQAEDNENECWLGWFCVDRRYRKNKIGQKLLDFSLQKAKELNKEVLKLYTYNSDKYKPAIKLYEKNFFHKYDVKDDYFYYSYNLKDRNYHTKLLELFTKDELDRLVDESVFDGTNIDIVFISRDTIMAEICVDYGKNSAKIAVLEDYGFNYDTLISKDKFFEIYNTSKDYPPKVIEVDC